MGLSQTLALSLLSIPSQCTKRDKMVLHETVPNTIVLSLLSILSQRNGTRWYTIRLSQTLAISLLSIPSQCTIWDKMVHHGTVPSAIALSLLSIPSRCTKWDEMVHHGTVPNTIALSLLSIPSQCTTIKWDKMVHCTKL